MNIEEMRTNKFTKFIVLALLIFTTLVIALGLNNSVDAVTVTSMGGKTWNIPLPRHDETDEGLANLYNEIQGLSENQIKNQELPNSLQYLIPGKNLGYTGTEEDTFNREGTFGDCGTYSDKVCQMICYEPSNSTGAINNSGKSKVWYILLVSKDKLTYYDGSENAASKSETKSVTNITDSTYLNNVLNEGYNAQRGTNNDCIHIGRHFADSIRNQSFNQIFAKYFTRFNTGTVKPGTDGTLCDCTNYSVPKDENYNYYGIFVYYGQGVTGQGRVIYKIVRTAKQKPVEVKFTKTDMANTQIEGASIKIECGDNASFKGTNATSQTISIGNKSIEFAPKNMAQGNFKLKITETKAPVNYTGFEGTITITVYYNTEGTVTKIESSNTTYIPNATSNEVKVRNKYTPPLKLEFNKIDFDGNAVKDAKIQITAVDNISTTSKTSLTSDENGYFGGIEVKPVNYTQGTFKIKIKETAPKNYEGLSNEVILTVTYHTTLGVITNIEADKCKDNFSFERATSTIRIKNKFIPGIRIGGDVDGTNYGFDKVGKTTGTKVGVPSVGFTAVFKQNGKTIATKTATSGADGHVSFEEIQPTSTDNVTVTITETSVPVGWKGSYSKTITFKYDSTKSKWTSEDSTVKTTLKGNTTYVATGEAENGGIIEKLTILKVDSDDSSKKLAGAKFKIKLTNILKVDGTNYTGEITKTVSEEGKIVLEKLEVDDLGKNITIEIEETEAPSGYKKINGTITITLKRQGNEYVTHTVTKSGSVLDEEVKAGDIPVNNHEVQLTIKNKSIPGIQIGGDVDGTNYGFDKVGKTTGTKVGVPNVGFTAVFKQNGKTIATKTATSGANGHVSFEEIKPTSSDNVTVTITETSVPEGWKGQFSKEIEFVYNNTTNKWETSDSTIKTVLNGDTVHVGLPDVPNNGLIENLTIEKKDLLDPNKVKELDGAEFKIKLTNISKVDGTNYTGPILKEVKNGTIVLKKLEVEDLNKDITITIEETKAPTVPESEGYYYKLIDGTITITLKRQGNEYVTHTVTKSEGVLDEEVQVGDIPVNNHQVKLTVNNLEVIKLSGQVWLDVQENDKDVRNPDGIKKDEEQKIKGVKVHLYSEEEEKIISTKTTDSDGKYEFSDVRRTAKGYKVYFEYNGILYNDVGISNDSKAVEDANKRKTFNERFKTIELGKSNDGTTLTYNYRDNKALLNAAVDGSTPDNSSIMAYTEDTYTLITKDIDFGLILKYYDLSVNNLIEGVKYEINGKEWTDTPGSDKTELSTSMYKSDYSYRYDDYGTNKLEAYQTELDEDNITRSEKLQEELEVFITYDLQVENLSIHDADEVVVKYTYDASKYELISINDEPTTANGEITLTVKGLTKDYNVKDYHIKFRLAKDAARNLPTEIINEGGLTVETTAEIMSYTTEEGALIDIDSEPGNGKEEDDLEKAKVNFKLKENERQISGKVAEANTEDGSLEAGKNINDVIVQLVELIEVDGNIYEYIWQETASGSNRVKARGKNKQVYIYNNELPEGSTGQYKFLGYSAEAKDSEGNGKSLETGFIPGNYIIRFIYGDGTVLYLNRDGNMDLLDNMTYNGQDYKSTVDMNYKAEDYDPSKYNGKSSARDNEARRLQVMAFSAEINGALGTALKTFDTDSYADLNSEEQELLKNYYETVKNENRPLLQLAYRAAIHDNPYATEHSLPEELPSNDDVFEIIKRYISRKTWMAAETSKIDVGIDGSGFSEVNFGLMKRPETKLEIEKHITALKITPTGTGVQPVLDAKADIGQILNALKSGSPIETTGIKNGLAVMGSTRADTGFWKVETDIEELMQGAPLEVEYTYVIRNNSEPDYLGGYLVSKFGEGDYKQELSLMKDEIDMYRKKGDATSNGQYLGEYYYTGKKGENDIEVPSIVNTLEEAINNQLAFNETSGDNGFTILEEKVNKNIYDTDGNPKVVEIKTVVQTKTPSIVLTSGKEDYSKTIELKTTLSASAGGEIGTTIPTYIAEIAKYSNAAGRENIVVPENLSYVHSDDNTITVEEPYNETDEFWGETIRISKPTGEDKNTPILITIITISGVAVLGVGIILIKKFVLKK